MYVYCVYCANDVRTRFILTHPHVTIKKRSAYHDKRSKPKIRLTRKHFRGVEMASICKGLLFNNRLLCDKRFCVAASVCLCVAHD